jgi:hypothetical protein
MATRETCVIISRALPASHPLFPSFEFLTVVQTRIEAHVHFPIIPETEYDNLFVVTVNRFGRAENGKAEVWECEFRSSVAGQ